ncbi:hypothetical protein [Streptomyces tritici]|uniref:hypothetical protein n=1 Tax=Streptomyces tritici TaxID=2054410 RepID=UPI003AF00EB7
MNGRRVAGPLLAALLLGVVPVAGAGGGDAVAGGVGDGALRLGVTVNGRGGVPLVRVGSPVVKRYRVVNRSEAHLYGVRVVDPSAGGRVRCPSRTLAALAAMECTARFAARPGRYAGTATATGDVPSLRRRLTAAARSGYEGVGGALALAETVRVRPPRSAVVAYTVTNRGNRAVHAVRLTDAALRPGRIDCGAGRAGGVPVLPPGGSVRCTATVQRPPGVHRSTGLATGGDRLATVAPGGRRAAAPLLVARAAAGFRVAAVPTPAPGATPPPVARGPVRPPSPTVSPASPASPVSPVPPAPSAASAPSAAASVPAGAAGAAAPAPGASAGAPPPPPLFLPSVPAAGPVGPLAVPGAAAGAAAGTGAGAGSAAGAGAGAGAAAGEAGAAAAGAGAAAGEAGAGAAAAGTGAVAGAAAGAVPPGAAGAVPPGAAGAVPPGTAAVPPAARPLAPPPAQSQAQTPPERPVAGDDEGGLLSRVRRRSSELADMGVALTLLLILIPAAVAAALLGSRRP